MKNNEQLMAKFRKTAKVAGTKSDVRSIPRTLTEADLRAVVGGADTCCNCIVDDCGIV